MNEGNKKATYIAGVCNIGATEIARRYRIGYFGLICSALVILAIEGLDLNRSLRLVIFVPAAIAFTGFLQARHRFCLKYGLKGVYSMIGMRILTHVTNPADLRQDRKKAFNLVVMIILGSVLSSIAYYLLPES